jgi:hypothetical protein
MPEKSDDEIEKLFCNAPLLITVLTSPQKRGTAKG